VQTSKEEATHFLMIIFIFPAMVLSSSLSRKSGVRCKRIQIGGAFMNRSERWPIEISWNYDRGELLADDIVNVIGLAEAICALRGPRFNRNLPAQDDSKGVLMRLTS
jgi:hypothetical protein